MIKLLVILSVTVGVIFRFQRNACYPIIHIYTKNNSQLVERSDSLFFGIYRLKFCSSLVNY